MNDKIQSILKILIIIILIILALIFKFIPEYKDSKGSSDTYININEYESIIELKVNKKTNFLLVITKSKISNILFLDETSFCLYNQNIETNSLTEGIDKIITILIENKLLKEESEIILTKYNNEYYDEIKEILKNKMAEKYIGVTYIEEKNTIEEKASSLSLNSTDKDVCIKELELYSKEIIRYKKNNVSASSNDEEMISNINSSTSKLYADSIYNKITSYAINNQIVSQDITSSALPISLIPADAAGTIYPHIDSWYYIKENKVYAYIVIEENSIRYSYCYQGALENAKEGECQ